MMLHIIEPLALYLSQRHSLLLHKKGGGEVFTYDFPVHLGQFPTSIWLLMIYVVAFYIEIPFFPSDHQIKFGT